jgi:Pectate lyase superfamily protein
MVRIAKAVLRVTTSLLVVCTICISLAGCGEVVTKNTSNQGKPAFAPVKWTPPAPIAYGTPLSATELDATSSIPGTFVYSPASGAVLAAGAQTLTVTFTPANTTIYSITTTTVPLQVTPATPAITWAAPAPIDYGTALSATELNATSNVPGTFVYAPASGTMLPAGAQTLTVTFTPTDSENYTTTTSTVQISVTPTGNGTTSSPITLTQAPFSTYPEEFVGPFSTWTNVKTAFGAVGDGVADDTAAFQNALNSLQYKSPNTVLWIPSGTYRITATLYVQAQMGLAIIGEDPTNTTIVWDGPPGGTMLDLEGDKWFRISRLTWDGAGLADTGHRIQWNQILTYTGGYPAFPTQNLESDEIFQGLNYGIRIGFAGETSINRVRFLQMNSAGISTENYDALDVWVRDSYFQGCNMGLTNIIGGGHFHVYNSIFENSTTADMEINATSYFSERGNTSLDSKAFFVALGVGTNSAQMTIQDNIIIDPKNSPFVIGNAGPLMLIDNTILLPENASYPVIKLTDWVPTNILSLGNKYSGLSTPLGDIGQYITVNDQTVSRDQYILQAPVPAPFLPNLHRTIIEVPSGASSAQIQHALDTAATLAGSRPVVHLPAGQYSVTQPLVIAGGSDVQLVGDSDLNNTGLVWRGAGSGPILEIMNPARATLRDVSFEGTDMVDGIHAEVNDVPGSRVLIDGTSVANSEDSGLFSNGLDQSLIELRSSGFSGGNQAIRVDGGALAQSGMTTFGRVSSFGGIDSGLGDGTSYTVVDGGKLTIEDNWHDGSDPDPNYADLTGSGSIMLQGGMMGNPSQTPFMIDGFRGDVSLLSFRLEGDQIPISGDISQLRFLSLGDSAYLPTSFQISTAQSSGMSTGQVAAGLDAGITVPAQITGALTSDFINTMFSRSTHIHSSTPLEIIPGLTDLRFDRVFVQNTNVGINFSPAEAVQGTSYSYNIADDDGEYAVVQPNGSTAVVAASSSPGSSDWTITRLDDGNYTLGYPGSNSILDMDLSFHPISENPSQEWIIDPIGDGYFSIRNALNLLYLSLGPDGPILSAGGQSHQSWQLNVVGGQ